MIEAADHGLATCSHIFNGYEPMHHRKSNAVVGIMLDDGTLIAGDLSPISYLQSEPEVSQLRDDWNLILDHHPKLVLFAHSHQLVF